MATVLEFAIFAHNEQRKILSALRSIEENLPARTKATLYVLINGSADRTLELVQQYPPTRAEVVPVEIAFADKCNAWNLYVHQLAGPADVYFLMDGDCQVAPSAIERMVAALERSPQAVAVAGVPQSGRNRHQYADYIAKWGWLFGNLYGVRSLSHVQQSGLRLPIGLMGNDHVITQIFGSDWEHPGRILRERMTFDPDAGYTFEPLRPYHWQDIKTYYKRRVRYRLRDYQLEKLAGKPLWNLPRTMDSINRSILDQLSDAHGNLDWWSRRVRSRLAKMYPDDRTDYYAERLSQFAASEMPLLPAA